MASLFDNSYGSIAQKNTITLFHKSSFAIILAESVIVLVQCIIKILLDFDFLHSFKICNLSSLFISNESLKKSFLKLIFKFLILA